MLYIRCLCLGSWLFLLKCSDPVNTNMYRTVRIAQHSGSDADPLFTYNTTYYVFGKYFSQPVPGVKHKYSEALFRNK